MGKIRASQRELDFGVRVGAVVEKDGRVLLVRHAKPGLEPYWVLPGGRLEPRETIPECAEREVREEAGLEGRFLEVLYVSEFIREGRHTVDITVRLAAGPGEARLGGDPEDTGQQPTLQEVRWFAREELAEINLLPRTIKLRILEDVLDGGGGGGVYLGSGS
ncbi:NUDIX hydrolase [Rubrobacter taiwanensis]|jgi:8-oxo-dGTP diphosphatase|uniref:NUDIX hydrolase n=1 Tax=Rubrobacter taiwanensis TaxID=185139 RepID=A0A4R1BFW1_9ACTN|nr:NUDIX hydrolase [Rubrobacter taiwanensis]TCJ16059.1 NUDIX hydrolase [Rubrobacter taiwanensis]